MTEAKVDYHPLSGYGPWTAYVDIEGNIGRGTEKHSDAPVVIWWDEDRDAWYEIEEG
jgi:hypothetical protein